LALFLLALLTAWLLRRWEFVGLAGLLLLFSLARPAIFGPLAGPWFVLSRILGEISSRIILTLLFLAVVTPVGLIRRLCGADPMQLRQWRRGNDSVLRRRDHLFQPEDLEKPY
jgi:hypothetical protein